MVPGLRGAVVGSGVWVPVGIGEPIVELTALDVPAMARVHGTLNAFGFSLAGVLGWVSRDTRDPVRRSVTP